MKRNTAKILIAMRRFRRRTFGRDPARLWLFAVIIGAAAAYGVIGFRPRDRFRLDHCFWRHGRNTGQQAPAPCPSCAPGQRRLSAVSWFRSFSILRIAITGCPRRAARASPKSSKRAPSATVVSHSREGLSAATVSAVSLGSGASAGREGPAGAYWRHDRFSP